MSDSYYDRLRKGTLDSLRIDPEAAKRGPYQYAVTGPPHLRAQYNQPVTIHPDQTLDRYSQQYQPGQSLDPALKPNRLENEGWSAGRVFKDLKYGMQEGATNLAGTVYGIQGPYSPRLASGKPLSQVAKETMADQGELEKNLATYSDRGDRLWQFGGGFIPNAARYALAEGATGGNPWVGGTLGGAGADVALLGSEAKNGPPPTNAMWRTAANSAGWGGEFEVGAGALERGIDPVAHAAKHATNRVLNYFGTHPAIVEPLAEAAHGAVEAGLDAGVNETTGEMVPSLFPSEGKIQSWVNPQYARLPGAPPQITPQQQYTATHDNPQPLPQPTETTNADGEGDTTNDFDHGCGRNSRTTCYATGGPVFDGLRRRSVTALQYADGGLLTLDPDTIQHELRRGPEDSSPIYVNADAAKLGPYAPVGPPSLKAQPQPTAPRSRLLGEAPGAQSYQFDARRMAPPVDTSQQSSVFDQPWEGPSPTWKPMTPAGAAIYGLGLSLMGDPEVGLSPRNIATQTGLGAMQALTPPRKDALQEGIIMGRPAEGPSGRPAESHAFVDPASIHDMAVLHGAQLGSGAYSPAEIAAARSRQVQDIIRNVSPPPETEATLAEGEPIRDVKARTLEDLDRRIPISERIASPDPTRLVNGQPFTSLNMDAPSEGFLPYLHFGPEEAEVLNQRLWADSIRESEMPGGSAAIDAVRKTGMTPPTAEFLHRSMSMPQRSRFWYELSGDSFTGRHMDIPQHMVPGFIDNVAATSGGAKPYSNLKRAIGSYAENLQGVPIYTDLRDPASVRNALNPVTARMTTPKYDNFSGTMQYTSGLNPRPPLSVNDTQMADIFNINGSDIGKNPVLYEVMSRYVNKLRDAQNALLPQGAQPWEAWQIQAPAWVRNRLDKDPTSGYDDYAQVFPRIIQELNNAGIPTPNGKVTLDTLMDPRTPNVMSGTRQDFMGSPIGTMEVATTKTPEGAAAEQFRQRLEQYDPSIPWVRDAKARYEQIQRNAFRDLAARHNKNPSFISQLMSEIAGQKLETSRLEWNGYGTYDEGGDQIIHPNLRIPMGGTGNNGFVFLTQPQREEFLSILGQDYHQDAMAASHFTHTPEEQLASRPPNKRTYSVWMRRYDNDVDQKAVQQFSRQLGYPVNVARVPNGILLDVNVADKPTGPAREAVENAANATFGNDPNVHDLVVGPRAYDSDFVHNSEYQEKINAQSQIRQQHGGVGSAGDTANNVSNIQRLRQENRRIAQKRDADFADWVAENEPKAAQLETGGGRRVSKRRPPPSP